MNAWDQIGGVGPAPRVTREDIEAARQRLGEAIDEEAHKRRILEIFGAKPGASLSDFRFRATIQGRQAVRFAGPGGFYNAELLKGGLGGLIGFGLQQLGRPTGLVAQVRRGDFNVYAPNWTRYNPGAGAKPREDGKFPNRPRRILIIEGREVAVLRFRQEIPLKLVQALKCLFAGREYHLDQPGSTRAHEGENDGSGQEDRGQSESSSADGTEP